MKVTWTWLAEWTDLPATPEELARGLALRGLPVESIERGTAFDSGIVVGRVLAVAPHPNADRLSLCSVDAGGAPLSVVCGAPNVAPGQRVAVALVGSRLPDGTKLRKTKIRGVESEGMICSERELGMSAESQGIWVIPGDPPVGAPLSEVLGGDVVLDVEVTPNRTDCMSVRGLAREIASLRGAPLKPPRPLVAGGPGPLPAVSIQDAGDCPRYMARVVRGLHVGPSPSWLRARLEASGFRSINNVVDATNYVLRTHGQPIHAFDAARVRGNRIEVRRARPGERLTLLDGRSVSPGPGTLVIADAEGAMALAGIMGGLDSGVTDATVAVVLESAEFDPGLTRESARSLALSTDASLRFTQGVDPESVAIALDDVARLLSEVAGGDVARDAVDLWPGRRPPTRIALRLARMHDLLGIEVDGPRATEALLGLEIRQAAPWTGTEREAEAVFEAPSHRRDLVIEADLIEEVARVVGYDAVPSRAGRVTLAPAATASGSELTTRLVQMACGLGFDEAVNTALIGALAPAWTSAQAAGALWEIKNPKSKELRHLRPSLLPGLVEAAARNLRNGAHEVRLVEAGKAFSAEPPPLGSERLEIALVIGGEPDPWTRPGSAEDRFLELKGAIEALLKALGIDSPQTRSYHETCWEHGSAVRIEAGGAVLARIGEVAEELREAARVDRRLWAAALDVAALERAAPTRKQYQAIHRYPATKRDLAIVVAREVPHSDLLEAIRSGGAPLLHEARLFDVFEGAQVGPGKKSMAFALEFRATDRTLSDREADEALGRVVNELAARFGAVWRGGKAAPAPAGLPAE